MPRIRTIKPDFSQSESMGRVSRDARLLFVLLITAADDDGRLRGSSRVLAALYPYDDDVTPELIDACIGELEREGCVWRYMVDGNSYVQITKWKQHQRIEKPRASKFPAFAEQSPNGSPNDSPKDSGTIR